MKILVTSFTFPPEANGVAEIAKAQACGLAGRGHEVTVVTGFHPGRTEEHRFGCLNLRQFKVEDQFDHGFYAGEVAAYEDFLRTTPADIILFNCWQNWLPDLAAPLFPELRAKTVMVTQGPTAQTWRRHGRFPWGLGQWLRQQPYVWRMPRLMRAFDQVVFLSARADLGRFFDMWLARRLHMKNYSIIPNGIHLEELRSARGDFRAHYGIPTEAFLVLCVANYCDRKNQLLALRAFLRADRADAVMVFIGSEHNDYTAAMEKLLLGHPARDRVRILERVPKSWINAGYRAADVFLLTAKAETQPLAILDAMGAGVPFVTTDVGCVREFPGGLLVRGETDAAAALDRLLQDRAMAARLGTEGQAAAESRYGWAQVIQAYEQLFERLWTEQPVKPGRPVLRLPYPKVIRA